MVDFINSKFRHLLPFLLEFPVVFSYVLKNYSEFPYRCWTKFLDFSVQKHKLNLKKHIFILVS